MFLTKQERRRIRKAGRAERERTKRDQQLMGLIPAPEPKFKLSNFMKVLGDQAIADPSKVEMRVLQQMRQRVVNHEMRNIAAKLTPQERKAKQQRRLQEDTSRQVFPSQF
jgi:U4/U6 small nuclear ribonucleoprotein PRP3